MAVYTTHTVAYPAASDPRHALDLYIPHGAGPSSALLVYIHGGAWRSESKEDFVNTLVPRLLKHTGVPLAVLEYRLAPSSPHPAQINDVLSGLSLLTGAVLDAEGGSPKWDRQKLFVAGHSAGAFMAASLVLRPPSPPPASPSASTNEPHTALHSFAVPRAIRRHIFGIICIDGIYDLPSLLAEYPSYHYFVDDAFGTDAEVLAAESPARWGLHEDDEREGRRVRVLVLHSREDELLSLRQPRVFLRQLRQLYVAGAGGQKSADEPVEGNEERDLPDNVEVDFDSVTGTHEGLLDTEELAKVIALRLR
ncbi:hypothetical protein JCM10213_003502 [Rhodosporidiobolus nylandii]